MTLVDTLFGRRLASSEEDEQKIGVFGGVPSLGLDGLSSAAYGPEAALTILLPLGAAGLRYIEPVTGLILVLLGILFFSYLQTISAYPNGGGSYTVASQNLGRHAGLLAAAALMLDYTLNVAVGISAGVGALISAVPDLHRHTVLLCLICLAVLTIVNLRGAREAGAIFAIPTYLFCGTLLGMVGIGIAHAIAAGGHPHAIIQPPPVAPAAATVTAWLLLRTFASGCTAMTGVEAVSNGVTIFAKPTVKNAQLTLTAIVVLLSLLLAGIAYLCRAYGVNAMDESRSDYQSVISQLIGAVAGRGIFYYVTIGSVLTVLMLSANTSYAGFPRLCRLVAIDGYMPHAFMLLGRRLVYTFGILFLTGLAGLLLVAFRGITNNLIPLFAVGAFLAFTLSQAGMVMHWVKNGKTGGDKAKLFINGLGALATACALVIILIAKFAEGAWITVVIIPVLVFLFLAVHRHYRRIDHIKARSGAVSVDDLKPPVVVIPIESWNCITERAVEFGLKMSRDVIGVHVKLADPTGREGEAARETDKLADDWKTKVVEPIEAAGLPAPKLVNLESPYRRVFNPLSNYLRELEPQYRGRQIAVIIPELVETNWWEWLLHNHRATALKASLLLMADLNLVVVNVPWFIKPRAQAAK